MRIAPAGDTVFLSRHTGETRLNITVRPERFSTRNRQRLRSQILYRMGVPVRFSLLDLLIAMTAVLLGTLVVEGIGNMFGFAMATSRPIGILLGIVAGLAIYLITTPLIYQRLRMRPLWYPLCPTCRDKNRFWQFEGSNSNWPRESVRCRACGTVLELWYGPVPNDLESPVMAPTHALLWPQSFGRWRRIDQK